MRMSVSVQPIRRLGPLACAAVVALAAWRPAASAELPDFRSLVEENRAVVVNISTTRTRESRVPEAFEELPFPEDSPYYEFFRRFFGEEAPEQFEQHSLGSGFLVSADGYIITNRHVVEDAEEIAVRLSDRREFAAEVIGSDERSDIALLKIDAHELPVAELATDDTLAVGEWVLAIGSPFGFEHSATAGIVSAKRRSLPNATYVPFIQTDVAINPGNSGGPLFNLEGEVVGVNAQIVSPTGGYMGLSFAVPIDVAMRVATELRTEGAVTRGWMGVLIQDVTRELAESFGLKQPRGAAVARVFADSPAAAAGIEVGDVILRFDGQRIEESGELPPLVGMSEVGRTVPIEIVRGGERRTLELTVGKLPQQEALERAGVERPVLEQRLGLAVATLGPEARERHGVEHGVRVIAVREGPAREAGVREGDLILRLGDQPVRDAAHLRRLASELPSGRSIPLLVQREDSPVFLALELGGGS